MWGVFLRCRRLLGSDLWEWSCSHWRRPQDPPGVHGPGDCQTPRGQVGRRVHLQADYGEVVPSSILRSFFFHLVSSIGSLALFLRYRLHLFTQTHSHVPTTCSSTFRTHVLIVVRVPASSGIPHVPFRDRRVVTVVSSDLLPVRPPSTWPICGPINIAVGLPSSYHRTGGWRDRRGASN